MAAYGANAEQTIQPGAFMVFETTIVPCNLGLIQHFDESPLFSLSGWKPNNNGCCCNRNNPTYYEVCFNANVALAEGATVEPISLVISIDGVQFPLSEMDTTPAAVGDYQHLSNCLPIPIMNNNCCHSVAVQNTSTQPITVKNGLIQFSRPDLANR